MKMGYFRFIVEVILATSVLVQGAPSNDGSGSTSIKNNAQYVGQTALYWGQASAQQQERLRYYCDSDSVDMFLLSFLNEFPNSKSTKHGYDLNLANACTKKEDSSLNCSQVGDDIKYCQSLGKKVFLSLGGEMGNYGFKNDEEAEKFGDTLWDSFGEGSKLDVLERPFGDAKVDGFDFDIENEKQTGYTALAKRLRQLSSGAKKEYKLTAAPQCPFPDKSTSDLIDEFDLDYIFVQFYNNECSLDQHFNFETWASYIQSKNSESKSKIFMGLPASKSSAGSGFVESELILSKIEEIWSNEGIKDLFGGVMFWDASQAFGFSSDVNINNMEGNLIIEVSNSLQGSEDSKTSEGSSGATVTNDEFEDDQNNGTEDHEDHELVDDGDNSSTILSSNGTTSSTSSSSTRSSSSSSSTRASSTRFSTAYPSALPRVNEAESKYSLNGVLSVLVIIGSTLVIICYNSF